MQLDADSKSESDRTKTFIGTTKKGIGPTYASKMNRHGLRVADLLDWDRFTQKYNYMYKIFQEKEKSNFDTQAELQIFRELREKLIAQGMIKDSIVLLNEALNSGKRILAEGANAAMLDIDFGTYPYVTSSNTTIGGVCTGLGVPPSSIETTIGIMKAYTTRVGEGAFPTE